MRVAVAEGEQACRGWRPDGDGGGGGRALEEADYEACTGECVLCSAQYTKSGCDVLSSWCCSISWTTRRVKM